MWTRRKIIGGIGALAVAPAVLASPFRLNVLSPNHELLSAIATIIWFDRSAGGREQLRSVAMQTLMDPESLLQLKESECMDVLCRSELGLRKIYASVNASDFLSGRTITLSGIVLSEMDVAALLASV